MVDWPCVLYPSSCLNTSRPDLVLGFHMGYFISVCFFILRVVAPQDVCEIMRCMKNIGYLSQLGFLQKHKKKTKPDLTLHCQQNSMVSQSFLHLNQNQELIRNKALSDLHEINMTILCIKQKNILTNKKNILINEMIFTNFPRQMGPDDTYFMSGPIRECLLNMARAWALVKLMVDSSLMDKMQSPTAIRPSRLMAPP